MIGTYLGMYLLHLQYVWKELTTTPLINILTRPGTCTDIGYIIAYLNNPSLLQSWA